MGNFMAPAFQLEEVVDPTGAGDTFAGGFLGFLASTERMDFPTLKMAILVGTIMASFTVEKFGTNGLQSLTSKELDARLGAFRQMIAV
jgi:sugar/nucleoside kinase (ribokinase family)